MRRAVRCARERKEESAADDRCEARGETREEEKGDERGGESSNEEKGAQQVSHLRRNVVEIDEGELDLHWDPSAFEI